eukprot:8205-Heterococcus_DN1.PRE.4
MGLLPHHCYYSPIVARSHSHCQNASWRVTIALAIHTVNSGTVTTTFGTTSFIPTAVHNFQFQSLVIVI